MVEDPLRGAFTFSCAAAEAALIQEAWQIAAILMTGGTPPPPGAALVALFPPTGGDDPFSGLTALFDDPDQPDFGIELGLAADPDDPGRCRVTFHGLRTFQPAPLADLVRICCQATLRQEPITFVWNRGTDRPVFGRLGGGWAAIFPHRIDFGWESEAFAAMHDATMGDRGTLETWIEDPDHPFVDWQVEVTNFETRLGYLDWVHARMERIASQSLPPECVETSGPR